MEWKESIQPNSSIQQLLAECPVPLTARPVSRPQARPSHGALTRFHVTQLKASRELCCLRTVSARVPWATGTVTTPPRPAWRATCLWGPRGERKKISLGGAGEAGGRDRDSERQRERRTGELIGLIRGIMFLEELQKKIKIRR